MIWEKRIQMLAEHRYNALNQRIAKRYETDEDAMVDDDDVWFVSVFNEKWQRVAVYRAESDSGSIGTIDDDPKQVFVLSGFSRQSLRITLYRFLCRWLNRNSHSLRWNRKVYWCMPLNRAGRVLARLCLSDR